MKNTLLMIVVSFALVGSAWAECGDADRKALEMFDHAWSNAGDNMKRDVSWFERNLASDFSGISSRTAKLYTKAEELADYKTGKTVTEWNAISDLNIRIDGNSAIVTGVNHVRGRDERNQPMDYRLRFTDTFIKRDGRWQVWASQGTRIP